MAGGVHPLQSRSNFACITIRMSVSSFTCACTHLLGAQECMDSLAARTGRSYQLVEYVGDPCAEHVAVAMGASCGTLEAVVHHLNQVTFPFGRIGQTSSAEAWR